MNAIALDIPARAVPACCAVCNGPIAPAFIKDEHQIERCRVCGHLGVHIASTKEHLSAVYGDDYFFGGGAGYPDYTAEADMLRQRGRDYARLASRYNLSGRVFDIGAAAGYLLKGFEDEGWTGNGVEPNAAMCRIGNEELGLSIAQGDAETFHPGSKLANAFDLVIMIQVVGHFHSPSRAMATAKSLIKPGGHVLIEFWDKDSLAARVFGRNWHEFSPPSVLHWFGRADLDRLMRSFSMRPVAGGRPGKRISIGHARTLLRYKLEGSTLWRQLLRLLDMLPVGITLPYPAVDLRWALYRFEPDGSEQAQDKA